jgi:MFS family permease
MPESVTAPDAAPVPDDHSGRQYVTLGVISLAALIVSLTQSLLVPVLPQIAVDLRTTQANTQWLLTSTLLVAAVAVPVFGRLADLFGKRRMLIIAMVVLVGSSLLCALTSDLALLITGRAIMGLSVVAVPLGISLVSSVLPRERAGFGIAVISAMLGIGGSLGLPLAGLVAENADYHWLFWICVGAGAAVLIGVLFFVPEAPITGQGRMDLVGTVLLAGALLTLLLPLAQASSWGWSDPKTWGLLLVSLVLLVVFVLAERAMESPLVDVVVNARPALLLTNIASLAVGFALFATLIGTAFYVQAPEATGYGFGASVLVSGLCLLPSGLAMLALSPVSAALTNRYGPRITLALGALIVGAGFVSRILLTEHLWHIVLGTTIAGAGTGIAYAAMPALILEATPQSEIAAANGLNALFRSVGTSLSSAVGGTILAAQTVSLAGVELPSLNGYRLLFALCTAAAVAGALIALVIPRSATQSATPTPTPTPTARESDVVQA